MLGFGRSGRSGRQDLVREGAVFRRVHADHMVEKARVLSVGPGPMGIPHVRFAVSFERARFAFFEDGSRVPWAWKIGIDAFAAWRSLARLWSPTR